MMVEIDISVIIPTYRRSEELGRCLDAVACQTFGHTRMEVVVVSDCPDQATLSIADRINEKYRELNLTCFFLPGNADLPLPATMAGIEPEGD